MYSAAKEAQASPPPLDRPLELNDWYSSLSEIMCSRGYLGQKTKQGFYAYSNNSQVPPPPSSTSP